MIYQTSALSQNQRFLFTFVEEEKDDYGNTRIESA